jgi:hypothetical protein
LGHIPDASGSWVGMAGNSGYFSVPIMFNSILVFSRNVVFHSAPKPFVGVYLLGFLWVVKLHSVVVLDIILQLVRFLELLPEDFMQDIFLRPF